MNSNNNPANSSPTKVVDSKSPGPQQVSRIDATDTRLRDPESKLQHIEACLNDDIEYLKTTGFEKYSFENQALPEVSLQHISLETEFLSRTISAPLMIAPMTGGNERGHEVNLRLARAAERWRIPMGVGSQRLAVENHDRKKFYDIRAQAPNAILFANFGGAQLVDGWGVDEARRAVEMIQADALFVHLNPIQEAIQGGEQDFRGLRSKLGELVKSLASEGIPVFAREVCFGMSPQASQQLVDCGVTGIDCSGAGGTSWAKVESRCAKTERRRILGEVFGEWGIPTAQSIANVRSVAPTIPLIACGGLRSGLDIGKALALGANIGAMARPFLLRAVESEDAIDHFLHQTLDELRVTMMGSGVDCIDDLRSVELIHSD